MLNIHNLSVSFSGEYLFEEISFKLISGDRVGLIGKNGAGKSTLLKLLSKEMELDAGSIAFEKDIPTRKATDEILRKADVEVSIVMEFDNVETVKRGLEINAGVAIIPKNTVSNESARNQLVTCRLDNSSHVRPLSLIHKKSRMLTPALRSFIEKMQNSKINESKTQTID